MAKKTNSNRPKVLIIPILRDFFYEIDFWVLSQADHYFVVGKRNWALLQNFYTQNVVWLKKLLGIGGKFPCFAIVY